MAFAGTTGPLNPGEQRTVSMDFTDDLKPGDAVASVTSAVVSVASTSKGTDANAAAIPFSPPVIQGNVVMQTLGQLASAPGAPAGVLQGNVLYVWAVTVLTLNGETLVGFLHIPCNAIA